MDEITIKRLKAGDKDAFTLAVMAIKEDAYKIAHCYLNNQEDSMDAVCDAIEKAYASIKGLRDPKFFKTWFIRIVINQCKMQLRKRGTVIDIRDEEHLSIDEPQCDDRLDLETLLERLNPLERLLIHMKYYRQYTFDEIAEAVDLPTSTVKTKIYTNLRWMRGQLKVKEDLK